MSRDEDLLLEEDDPDPTDKLPVLDPDSAEFAEHDDSHGPTGTWVQTHADAVELHREIEQRDTAIAELTTLLRQKSFALSRAEKDLDQARAELVRMSVGRAASRDAAGLDQRVQELQRENANISALHDERRAAIAGLEDALSEAREREHQLEARLAELAAQRHAGTIAHEQDLERLADAEEKLLEATRQSLSTAGRQEQQRLQERIGELEQALVAARTGSASGAAELDVLKDELASQYDQAGDLKGALAEREARIESLLENLRSREARRRFAADIRRAAAPDPATNALRQRIAELEAALAQRPGAANAPAGPDDPTLAGDDRDILLQRVSELAAGIARRDDRIAQLESGLYAVVSPPETPSAPPAADVDGQPLPVRYLVRLDDGAETVHALSRAKTAIGRTPDNDLQIRESYISRVHAYIRLGPESAILEDAASRNGVFVNERRVRRELLKDGDIVMFGKARFRFQAARS